VNSTLTSLVVPLRALLISAAKCCPCTVIATVVAAAVAAAPVLLGPFVLAGSVLTQKIATDGLADAFMAFNTNYHDTGLFGVYAVTDRERSPDLSWVIMNEVGTDT
jgi:processing peptidase subunit beta